MTTTPYYQVRTFFDGPQAYTITHDKDTVAEVTSFLLAAAGSGQHMQDVRVDYCQPVSPRARRDFRDKALESFTAEAFLTKYSG